MALYIVKEMSKMIDNPDMRPCCDFCTSFLWKTYPDEFDLIMTRINPRSFSVDKESGQLHFRSKNHGVVVDLQVTKNGSKYEVMGTVSEVSARLNRRERAFAREWSTFTHPKWQPLWEILLEYSVFLTMTLATEVDCQTSTQ